MNDRIYPYHGMTVSPGMEISTDDPLAALDLKHTDCEHDKGYCVVDNAQDGPIENYSF